jgi:hypothetical protein
VKSACVQTLNIFITEGDRSVISKTLKESHSSQLKFFGDVDIFLLGKSFFSVWNIIIRHEVFHTLQFIQIMVGLWRLR